MLRKERVEAREEGYVLAKVERIVFICTHGAAQGVWKYRMKREEGEEEVVVVNCSSDVISWRVRPAIFGAVRLDSERRAVLVDFKGMQDVKMRSAAG